MVAGGTVYVGSYDDNLYALDTSNLSLRWSYYAAGNVQSTPAVDSNGTVYFGSDLRDPFVDNRNVNALYSDGTVKWQYSTGSGDVRGTPLVRPDGTVYIGSFNFNFYAINQFAVPKSLKDKFITYETGAVGGVAVSVDNADDWLKSSTSKGPWAVRMEVYRSASANASAPVGYYSYLLRTWVRQCEQASLQRRDRYILRRHAPDLFTGTAAAPDGADHQPQPHRKHPVPEVLLRLHIADGVGRQPERSHPQFEAELRAVERPDRHLRPGLARLDHLPIGEPLGRRLHPDGPRTVK